MAGSRHFYGIQDRGVDVLGQYRMAVPPEASYRYRLFGQHRELLPYDLQLSVELGLISDRNFVEEYYKSEYDQLKDETTGVELKRLHDNTSWSITADDRVNDFVTDTNWLPRADHFWLGQPLFRDAFTWYEHSNAGYAQFNQKTIPHNLIAVRPPVGTRRSLQLPAVGTERCAGRAIRHAARDRLAVPARPGQSGSLRPRRGGPLG